MRKTIIPFLALLMSALYGYADENKSSLNVNSYLQFKTYFVAPKDRWRNYALVLNRSELAVFWEPNSIVNCLISIGDDEMMLGKSTIPKDVKFDFKASSLFVLSLGIHKLPFSWELLESDTDLDFINRSESVLAFAPYRMIGVQIAGETGFFEYVFRVSDSSTSSYSYSFDDDNNKYVNGRIVFNFTNWFHFAISEFYSISGAPNNTFKYYMVASAGELILDFHPLVFKGEYLHGYPDNYFDIRSNFSGYTETWYAQFGYTIFDDYELLLKWDHLWSSYDYVKNKYLLGVNYYYNKNLKLQFNWEYNPVNPDERHKFIFQLQSDFDIKI